MLTAIIIAALALPLAAWALYRALAGFGPGQGSSAPGVTFQCGPSVTPVAASSGNVAATATTATLPAVAGKVTWIEGFDITGAGATAASIIQVTVTGLQAGTQTFNVVVPAGATTGIGSNGNPGTVSIRFPTPLPGGTGGAIAQNTSPVVNVPSFGSGNTAACVTAYGFQA